MKCDCIDRGVSFCFLHLGYFIGRHPGYFIIVPILISAFFATGLQRLHYEQDPEYLFSPFDGRGKAERQVIEDLFPMNESANFDLGRMTRLGKFGRVIVASKDGETVLRASIFREVIALDAAIRNITVEWDDRIWRYEDICAKRGKKCFENVIISMAPKIEAIEQRTFLLKYPLMINEATFKFQFLGAFLGGVTRDPLGFVESARTLALMYYVDSRFGELGDLWESAFLQTIADARFDNVSLYRFVSKTLPEELERNTASVLPSFSITVLIMLAFSVITCCMMDWVRSKPWLGVLGCLSSGMAVASAFGLVSYCGVEFIGINLAAPFLMLGIGMDDTFVLLGAWRRTDPSRPVEERLGKAFGEAGVSITITSLTNFISFWIGIITPFPSVRIFCIYTAMAVLFTYVYQVTMFGGCLAVSGYAEHRNLHSLVCVPAMPRSLADGKNICFRLWCTGGRNPADPNNPRDNKEHAIMVMFRDQVGGTLCKPWVKVAVVVFFLVYLAGGLYGCTRVKEGLERKKLSRSDSYSVDFYEMEDQNFREYPFRVQVIVNDTLNYADPAVQRQILGMLEKFESSPFVAEAELSESWLRAYLKFINSERTSIFFQGYNLSRKADFIRGISDVFFRFPVGKHFKDDILFEENLQDIIATRYIIQTTKVRNANEEKDMVLDLRRIADSFSFPVSVFNTYFVFFDQFILVRDTSIQAICVAAAVMMVISLLFIPSTTCALWVAFSIISIEIGVIGYMTHWDVNLDSISMINLIMCIGFSVDYSAHISYAYITSDKTSPNERMKMALHSVGMPIFQGSASTILGIIALYFAPSYIFLTFFKTVFLVISFGALHGILLLPVLLSFSDSCCLTKSKDKTLKGTHPFFVPAKEGDIVTLKGPVNGSAMVIPRPNYTLNVATLCNDTEPTRTYHQVLGMEGKPWMPPETQEKDQGIGTSGEESSNGSWKSPKEEKSTEEHVNNGFVPDEDGTTTDAKGPSPSQTRMAYYHAPAVAGERPKSSRPHHHRLSGLGFRSREWHPGQTSSTETDSPLTRYMSRINSGYVREYQLPL